MVPTKHFGGGRSHARLGTPGHGSQSLSEGKRILVLRRRVNRIHATPWRGVLAGSATRRRLVIRLVRLTLLTALELFLVFSIIFF